MSLTKEDLKNMPPEEIAKLQQENCIFCHIVSGKVASKKVYEDDNFVAILDINPANPGHILLLIKKHYQIMPQVPDNLISEAFMAAKHLSQAVLKALKAQGTNIFIANGTVAGQNAPHFMIHIIPRKEGDGLEFNIEGKEASEDDLEKIRKLIKNKVDVLFGIESNEPIDLDNVPKKIKQEVVEAEFTEESKSNKPDLDKIGSLFK